MECLNCGKSLTGRQTKFCCTACQQDYQYHKYIESWKAGKYNGLVGDYALSSHVKRYLLEKADYKCEKCGWSELNPYTNKIPLEVHHKDGDHTHNTEDNLEVVCPNCHALTENYKNANKAGRKERTKYYTKKKYFCIDCGKEISNKATRCVICNSKLQRTSDRPKREEFKKLLRTTSFLELGRIYGVSDNAIRKWCKLEQLPTSKKLIMSYSDEEWRLI